MISGCGSKSEVEDIHFTGLLDAQYLYLTPASAKCRQSSTAYGATGKNVSTVGPVPGSSVELHLDSAIYGDNAGIQSLNGVLQVLRYGGYGVKASGLVGLYLDLDVSWMQFITGRAP
ncbi:unnamed protein product, partial [Gongylonema pulchrum]|uniref:Lipoprotein n=1 Tax=Gongylonema pulchrum TaxID=637853 RepID=A0A183DE09_9BILA